MRRSHNGEGVPDVALALALPTPPVCLLPILRRPLPTPQPLTHPDRPDLAAALPTLRFVGGGQREVPLLRLKTRLQGRQVSEVELSGFWGGVHGWISFEAHLYEMPKPLFISLVAGGGGGWGIGAKWVGTPTGGEVSLYFRRKKMTPKIDTKVGPPEPSLPTSGQVGPDPPPSQVPKNNPLAPALDFAQEK